MLAIGVPGNAPWAHAQDGPEQSARLAVTFLTGVIGPAVAIEDEPPAEDLRLRVLVSNDGEAALDNLTVVVETYRATSARSLLQQALDDAEPPGGATSVTPADVRPDSQLPPGDIASVAIRVSGNEAGWLGSNGIYPVQVSVVRGTDVLDRVVTAVIHLTEIGVPLPTSVVWPVDIDTQRGPDGSYPVGADALTEPRASIDARLNAFEQVADEPLTLAPGTAMLEELADRADGFPREDGSFVPDDDPVAVQSARLLARLAEAAQASPHDPVVGPYAGVDVAALSSGPPEVAELAVTALTTARTRAQDFLGRAPSLQTYLATTDLTPQSLDVLPIDHALVDHEQMGPPALGGGEDGLLAGNNFVASAAGRFVDVTIADPVVRDLLTSPDEEHGATVAAQRLLAETAMIYLEAPQDGNRGLLAMPAFDWTPQPLIALEQARALAGAPWLDLMAPAALDDVPSGPAPPGQGASFDHAAASLPSRFVGALSSALNLLDALQAALPDPQIEGRTPAELSDALLRSATPQALADPGTTALQRVERVTALVEEAFGVVDVPDGRRVTLTSDSGEVPVTLQRREGDDIQVVVEVDSVGRLVWEEGERSQSVLLPADSTRTLSFTTTAVSRGTFPVTISVWDPTRTRLLDSATLSVRATAISTPALVGTAVVVIVLLALGARRRRRPTLEVVR